MGRRLHQWISCPECGSDEVSLLAYNSSLSLQCYDCRITDEFEFDEPPLQEFAPDNEQ